MWVTNYREADFKLLTDIIAERFMKKLDKEIFNERISMVEKYKKQWVLSEIEFKSELSINNLIFYAVSKRYGEVILKILINSEFDEDYKEMLALKLFQGESFCELYEYSFEDKVYLMERIVPAHTLYESEPRNERIKIVSEIFKGLHKTDSSDSTFPTYTEWFEAGKEGTKNRKDCEELYQYLDSAEQMLIDICQKYSRNFLLHGDLHHENILKNENGGYTVIDPKGVIGDPVFDLSRFILDEFRDDLTSEPKDVVIDFVQKLGDGVGISCEILLRCLYIETVIWLFREELANGESLEECRQLITNMKVAHEFTLSK
ncbi:MAG: phosphotransferase [Lachnospiraceae bacterium]|nr:phosphotransferase [Lachnospiraceae bacterium]